MYTRNVNQKNNFLLYFDAVVEVSIITVGQRIYTFMTNFLEDSLFVWLHFFSGTFWIEKLHYFHEGIYFPKNGCHGNRKKSISQLSLESYRFKDTLKPFLLTSCCSRLRLWVGYFIHFKFTLVFFYLMFLMNVWFK